MAIAKGKVADAQRSENSRATRLGAAYDAVLAAMNRLVPELLAVLAK
jgi:hypothetical protein